MRMAPSPIYRPTITWLKVSRVLGLGYTHSEAISRKAITNPRTTRLPHGALDTWWLPHSDSPPMRPRSMWRDCGPSCAHGRSVLTVLAHGCGGSHLEPSAMPRPVPEPRGASRVNRRCRHNRRAVRVAAKSTEKHRFGYILVRRSSPLGVVSQRLCPNF